MRFTVNIEIENDAFQPDWKAKVSRILSGIKYDLYVRQAADIRDSNGNLVGSYGLRTDNECQDKLIEALSDLVEAKRAGHNLSFDHGVYNQARNALNAAKGAA